MLFYTRLMRWVNLLERSPLPSNTRKFFLKRDVKLQIWKLNKPSALFFYGTNEGTMFPYVITFITPGTLQSLEANFVAMQF